MAKKNPRIADEHHLDVSAVKGGMHEGEWVRVNQYDKSHRIGVNGEDAYCASPLVVDHEWWAIYQQGMARLFDRDPGEWWIAEEHRVEGNHCTPCKGTDRSQPPEDAAPAPFDPFVAPDTPTSTLTPAAKLQRRRFYAAVSRVARQLDAEIL